jgi:glycosyl transferase family 87
VRDLRLVPSNAYWAGIAAGLVFLIALGIFDQRLALARGNDFAKFWATGRAFDLGADPYDPAQWARVAQQVGFANPTEDTSVPNYFPWTVLFLGAVALVPLDAAAWIWCLASVAIAAVGIAVLLRVYPCSPAAQLVTGFIVLAAQPALTTLMIGNWSLLLTGAMGIGVAALERGRIRLAVAPLLAMLAKPQLFILAAPVLVLRRPRVFLPLAAITVAIVAVATAAMPDWLDAWLRTIPAARINDRAAVLSSLGVEMFGPTGRWIAEAALVALGLTIALRFGLRSSAALSAWLAFSVLAAPYSWAYDWLLLVVPLVVGVSVLGSTDPRRALILALTGLLLLTLVAYIAYAVAVTRGRETWSAVVPLAFTLALVASLWPIAHAER